MRLLLWLGTVVAISVVSIFLSHNHALDSVENLSLTASSPLEHGIRDVAEPVNNVWTSITNRGDLRRENERLREENAALKAQIAEQQDLELRIEDLEAALEVKQALDPEQSVLAANVIAQEPGGFKRQIAIDRGLSDGIDEGMSVLSESGVLIGTVSRAYEDFAWIRLITDPESAINAQINLTASQPGGDEPQVITPDTPASPTPTPAPDVSQEPSPTPAPATSVRGVAEGDLSGRIILELPSNSEVVEGDLVVTSGLGGNYPRALLIGAVESISSRPQSPFTRTVLKPAADLGTLDTVLVLVSFEPARLEGP